MGKDIFFELSSGKTFNQIIGYMTAMRRIPIVDDIDEKLMNQVGAMLLQLDYQSNDPITLLLHSRGGDCENGLYLENIIRGLNSPVHGLVVGRASSMAVDILQMCSKRMMLPQARLFCHFVRTGGFKVISNRDDFSESDANAIRRWVLETQRRREQLYVNRTGRTLEDIRKIFDQGEHYNIDLNSDEAIQEKFADEIVTDFKFFPGHKGIEVEKKD